MTENEKLDEYKQALDGLVSYPLNSISAHKKVFGLGFSRQEDEKFRSFYSLRIACDWQILQNENIIYQHPILKGTLRKGKQELEILSGKTVATYILNSLKLSLHLYFEDDLQLRILLKDAKDEYELNQGWRTTFPRTSRQGGSGSIYHVQEGKLGMGFWIS